MIGTFIPNPLVRSYKCDRTFVFGQKHAGSQCNLDLTQQHPLFQFEAQDILCAHTDPIVANGSLSVTEVACATILLNPLQLSNVGFSIEQEQHPVSQSYTVASTTLDTHDSILAFDGAYNHIVSLEVVLKGKCTTVI